MKFLLTGGIRQEFTSIKKRLRLITRSTDFGTIDEFDLETGKFKSILRSNQTDTNGTLKGGKDFKLTSPSIMDGKLFCCSGTEAFIYQINPFKLLDSFSHPYFNDLHHISIINNEYVLANTGLDAVLKFDMNKELVEVKSVVNEDIWNRFNKETDFRKIPSTKPHSSHPNHVFQINGDIWVTRFKQRDAINLNNPKQKFDIGIQGIHDGYIYQDLIYFTTVDGKIIEFDKKTTKQLRVIDLYPLFGWKMPMGWCRGFCRVGNIAIVGFTALRQTKLEENLSWLKGDKKRNMDSFIIVFDVEKEEPINQFKIPSGHTDVIFGVLPFEQG